MSYFVRLLVLGWGLCAFSAWGDTIVLKTSPAALGSNDALFWNGLGPDSTTLSSSFSAVSGAGVTVNGSFSNTGGLEVRVCGTAPCSWGPASGDYAGNDAVIWAFDGSSNSGTGPITFTFPALFGVGAAVQSDAVGAFTAKLELFNGVVSLGSVTRASASGDALFIGALDTTGRNVTRAVFSLTSVAAPSDNNEGNNIGDFSVDSLSFNAPVAAPEPGTLMLFGTALTGIVFGARGVRARQVKG